MDKMLDIKPFQESLHKSMCGPASLKIVSEYYGVELTEKRLAELSGWNESLGVDAAGIAKAAKELGFKVKVKNNSDFGDVKYWLNARVPVIVNWFTRGRSDYQDSEVADGHYSVVAGLDDDFMYLQDPEIGRIRKIRKRDFLRVWFDFKGECIKPGELIIRQLIAIYK